MKWIINACPCRNLRYFMSTKSVWLLLWMASVRGVDDEASWLLLQKTFNSGYFQFQLRPDNWPQDTGWSLIHLSSRHMIASAPIGAYHDRFVSIRIITEEIYLEKFGLYNFTILDSSGGKNKSFVILLA